MKKRIEYFSEEKRKIHISLKNGKFYNGYIKEIRLDFIIFKDQVLGEIPIWFNEINEDGIDPYKEVGA